MTKTILRSPTAIRIGIAVVIAAAVVAFSACSSGECDCPVTPAPEAIPAAEPDPQPVLEPEPSGSAFAIEEEAAAECLSENDQAYIRRATQRVNAPAGLIEVLIEETARVADAPTKRHSVRWEEAMPRTLGQLAGIGGEMAEPGRPVPERWTATEAEIQAASEMTRDVVNTFRVVVAASRQSREMFLDRLVPAIQTIEPWLDSLVAIDADFQETLRTVPDCE